MSIYFIDGEFLDKQEVSISVDDRGYYFGDGVYEVIKVYNGKLYTGNEHIQRLFESADKIKLSVPYTEQQIIEIASQLVENNNLDTGHIYLQVTRGNAPRVHQFPNPSIQPVFMAYALTNPRPIANMEAGVAVKSVEDVRWLRCDIKSLNLLGNVLAKQEAQEAGCFEALLHRDGVVTEGSSSNFFGIKDGIVYTHPATNLILNGITRQTVIKICQEIGLTVEEKAFTLGEALQMDELFLTSTTSEVMPVISVDQSPIGEGQPGVITNKLQEAFAAQIPVPVGKN